MCAFALLLQFDFLTAQCVPYVPFVLHMISASEFVITQLHDFAAWSLQVSALRPGATPGRPVFVEFSLQAYAGWALFNDLIQYKPPQTPRQSYRRQPLADKAGHEFLYAFLHSCLCLDGLHDLILALECCCSC